MSMSEWTPESIKQYERAIKVGRKQEMVRVKRRDKWMNDFIDGKPVKQIDEYIDNNTRSQAFREKGVDHAETR